MKKLALLLFGIMILDPGFSQDPGNMDPVRLVNPFIGTGGHGHTYPGATVPFGMVQLSPDTRLEGWDGCSAYHGTDSVIYGFSHTHLSGTGCSDYGDILIMPVTGSPELENYGYASPFRKQEEKARAGYYEVKLDKDHIFAELTASRRCGVHRYTFSGASQPGVVLDLKHRDKVLESGFRITGPDEFEGYRVSQAWAQKQMIFFVIKFNVPFTSCTTSSDGEMQPVRDHYEGTGLKALISFSDLKGNPLVVKVGLSGVSTEGARKNLMAEIGSRDFDSVSTLAGEEWKKELGKIIVEGGTYDQHVVFNTALYHALLQPNIYSDVDGSYRGRDLQVHKSEGFDYYTVFSLWDTYRAAHPLYTIIDRKRTGDFIKTFIRQYEEGGMLPVWELSSNETGCMIGYHAVPVIADAWLKGIRDFDGEKAFEAMKHSANQDHLGLKYYKTKGYIPADKEGESVSKTLEYAFDDWCIAAMAKSMGRESDYKLFIRRAQSYKNVFDRITGFMRAKSNETWFTPFDPAEVNFNYTEANSWQYSFYVPQDIGGLTMMMGGREGFASKLDQLFSADSKTTGRDQADITGLIGQYAHGNEPSHHMAYLYNFAGMPWKTQELVHRICRDFYRNAPDGLIGNEDCGQMSAWYVFSALGFYPVNPASGMYILGTPVFPRATIRLENGKTFTVRASNLSAENFYIQSVSLNGKPVVRSYILHEEIMKGGELVISMGPAPNKAWGTTFTAIPESIIRDYPITPVPAFYQGDHTFMDSAMVAISTPIPGLTVYYTLDGSEPSVKSTVYRRPFLLWKTTTIKAIAISQEAPPSPVIEAQFIKIPKNRKISLGTAYAGQYAAGGDLALIDFKRGGDNFRTGAWQGYEGVDVEAVINLGAPQTIRKLSAGFLQDQASWIFMPTEVSFWVSEDGINYQSVGEVTNDVDEKLEGTLTKDFSVSLKAGKISYIKMHARNRGKCPDWHPGAGGKAWLMADEIVVE